MSYKSYANLKINFRLKKSKKILRLIDKFGISSINKVLEVGTGSGYIASYFSEKIGAKVFAVDVTDERQVTNGFNFQIVEGTTLPFADETFDFIISNHVIEHVGKESEQKHHLAEIFRCLESGGAMYFALPNRWCLIEPHYQLPILSWLPQKLASSYLRLFKLGSHYDCNPLSRKQALLMLQENGFECLDVTLDAIPILGDIEGGWVLRFITSIPKPYWRLFSIIMPTLIFICRKPVA
jgi:ubiquinone/menaquinone biosynthesis C-methylase UbiE